MENGYALLILFAFRAISEENNIKSFLYKKNNKYAYNNYSYKKFDKTHKQACL